MRLNVLKLNHLASPRTHEGAPAVVLTPEQALRRSVLSCMLWENEFYEDGVQIAGRIHDLVPRVDPEKVAALAIEARVRMKLRHHVGAPRGKGYVIDVASNRNGVGYGEWTHVDGWSEAVVDYIAATESADAAA